MRCPDCGKGNSEQDKFCAFCGHELSKEVVAIPDNETIAELTPEGVSYSDEPNPTDEVVSEADLVQKKKKSKVPLVILLTMLVVGMIAGGIYAFNLLKTKELTPEELLTEAYFQLLEAERGTIATTLKFDEITYISTDSNVQMIIDVIKDLEFDSVVRFDLDTHQVEGDMHANLMGADFVSIDYYFDAEKMMLDIPLIYDKAFHITYEDLFKMIQGDVLENAMYGSSGGYASQMMMGNEDQVIDYEQLEGAIEIILSALDRDQYEGIKDIDQTIYKEVMTSYYTEVVTRIDVEKDSTVYYMPYDEKEANYLTKDMIELMADDPAVLGLLEEIITKFYGKVIEEENYMLYALLTEQYLDEITEWEGSLFEAELELQRQEVLLNLKEEIKKAENDFFLSMNGGIYQNQLGIAGLDEIANIDIVMTLDENNHYQSQTTIMDMDLSESLGEPLAMVISITNNYEGLGQEVDFNGIDYDRSLDIGQLDEGGLRDLAMEIQENVLEKVMDNPMFSDLFDMGFY